MEELRGEVRIASNARHPLLSVAIPVFNRSIRRLLEVLSHQIVTERLADEIEILVFDDNSTDETRGENRQITSQLSGVALTYVESKSNLGRSMARNALLERAAGEYVLFLDCDVLPDDPSFVRRYFNLAASRTWDVVCGGITYRGIGPSGEEPHYRFYVYLSEKTDVKPAIHRNIRPWAHILTSNVMVRREVIGQVPFDPAFAGYGYEDLDWAIRLHLAGHKLLHIDNPCTHLGLVGEHELYHRMVLSVKNYALLSAKHPEFFRQTRIYWWTKALSRLALPVLQVMARLLGRLYFIHGLGMQVKYGVFQLSKAIWLAIALREFSTSTEKWLASR
jgi:glycosyltransferase involved in cell wall biosynthesis